MTITELINRLEELKTTYGGDLMVGVEDNSRPFLFVNPWINKVEIYQETYCCIIMDDVSDIIDDYSKKSKKLLLSKIVDL